jgi:hypothetical protein
VADVPDDVIAAMRGSHQLGIFFRLDIPGDPLRFWLGMNDIPAGIDGVDPTTQEVYLGGGILREIPNLEAVLNGVADRAEFQVSGIDPVLAARLDYESYDVRGRDFHVGITVLDDNCQPISAIIPLITGRGSFVTESREAVQGAQNATVTLGLNVGFGITTRDRQSQVLWSAPHHKALYPTDLFCDGTTRLERGATPTWPRF